MRSGILGTSSHFYAILTYSITTVFYYIVIRVDLTSDPLLVDPANGDFRLKAGSPCKATGFPGQFLGGSLGYLDMGAVQMRGFPAPIFGGLVVA